MKFHQRFSCLLLMLVSCGGLNLQLASGADESPNSVGASGGYRPNVLFWQSTILTTGSALWANILRQRHPISTGSLAKRLVSKRSLQVAPVCSASRHALLSGLRPSTTGWYSNTSKSYPTILELCHLPNVKGLEGISLIPQLENPQTRRAQPAITTWHYNNHAAQS